MVRDKSQFSMHSVKLTKHRPLISFYICIDFEKLKIAPKDFSQIIIGSYGVAY